MELVVITFVVSLGTIFGAYWFFVLRPEDQEKATAVRRLKGYKVQAKSAGVVLTPEKLSSIPWLESVLSTQNLFVARAKALLVEAGLSMNVGTFLLLSFAGGTAGFFVGSRFLGLLTAGMALGAIGAFAPYAFVRYKRASRLRMFEDQFPEAIDLISRALRAGHAFNTGIGMVADEIGAPVGTEFRRLYDEHNFGMSLPEALRAMASRVPLLDARFFVTAVLTQRESGGNLSEVLDNLASVMRDRFKLKRQIRVVSAHGRMSAWILAAVPPVIAGMMYLVSPELMSPLFTDPVGVQLIMVALALQVTGTIVISRMVKLEY